MVLMEKVAGRYVRTACTLSAITGIFCRILDIRKEWRKPELKLRHLVLIRNLKSPGLCNGDLDEDDSFPWQEVF